MTQEELLKATLAELTLAYVVKLEETKNLRHSIKLVRASLGAIEKYRQEFESLRAGYEAMDQREREAFDAVNQEQAPDECRTLEDDSPLQ